MKTLPAEDGAPFTSARLEAASALIALVIGLAVAVVLLTRGGVRITQENGFAFFDSTILAPLLGLAGVWLDVGKRQPLGLIVGGLAVLLALDGTFATYLLGLPVLILLLVSLQAGIRRRTRSNGDGDPN